ncbi:MAG: helix-turn-helix transcriptional regulator [Clostridia bacterium]|nr:helix-turn-helix transcriptional regulator [Clostridia bacterium]
MWLENLKELKKSSGMSARQIADATKIPESTIKRIFAGDTDNPYVDTLRRIVSVLGGSLDDLFAESKMRVANTDLISLQAEYDKLAAENAALKADLDRLRLTLEHKEEILKLQNEIIRLHKTYAPVPME